MNWHGGTDHHSSVRGAFVHTLLAYFDPARATGLELLLRRHGHEVRRASNEAEAREFGPGTELILIDVDGHPRALELCRTIRASEDTALIAVSDRNTEHERVRVLEAGCDEHLHRGYGPMEVMARIDAVLRWVRPSGREASLVVHGPLTIDTRAREVRLDGVLVHLTRKEFDLLRFIAARAGAVTDRAEVLLNVWGGDSRAANRTLDTHVSSLRRKLGRRVCVTVKGYGLRIGTPEEISRAD